VPVPAVPATDLVVREAHLSFCFLKAYLHPPAADGYLRQFFERSTCATEKTV
jgi:hypothetical protein